jgi:integrase/recombinase XerD
MIESLYLFGKQRRIQRETPLLAQREGYLQHMLDLGISLKTIQRTATLLVQLVRIMQLECMRTIRLDEVERAADQWLTWEFAHRKRPLE